MAKKGPAGACVIPAEPGGGNRKPIETTAALASNSPKMACYRIKELI